MEWWHPFVIGMVAGIVWVIVDITWRIIGPSVRYLWSEWRNR